MFQTKFMSEKAALLERTAKVLSVTKVSILEDVFEFGIAFV
jgi:hypothetical protein